VLGNNAQGQLNLDPKIYPKVEKELMYHEEINSKYQVIDIGCGSNHTVFIAKPKSGRDDGRRILT